jgi:hypothetical protein
MNTDSTIADTLNFSTFIKSYRSGNNNASINYSKSAPKMTSNLSSTSSDYVKQTAGAIFNVNSVFEKSLSKPSSDFIMLSIVFLIIFLGILYEYNFTCVPKKVEKKTKESSSESQKK